MKFVSTILRLKRMLNLDRITVPIISRDDESLINHWLNESTYFDHTPLNYLDLNGINIEVIANDFENENGLYTGNVHPSEKSKILFPENPLITLNKMEKYTIGGRRRLILIDNEEEKYIKNHGYDEKLFFVNIHDRKNLQKNIEKSARFLNWTPA